MYQTNPVRRLVCSLNNEGLGLQILQEFIMLPMAARILLAVRLLAMSAEIRGERASRNNEIL